MAGLTPEGFEAKTLEDADTEIANALKGKYGDSVDLTPNEPLGQAKGIWADREADLWDLAQTVYRAFDPDSATGAALRALCALTGTTARAAAPSTVLVTCTGTAGTALPAGRQASVSGTGTKFQTLADAALGAATAWVASTSYVLGDRRTNATRIYLCTTAGTSAGSGGPTTQASDITDGSVHWRWIGDGAAFADVEMASVDTGPKVASAGTLIVIETAVGGWSNLYNALDAELGRADELDPALRLRRELELQGGGRGTLEAIRANLLQDVPGVTAVTVFENTSLTTDGDGVPGKAIEVLIQGGDDEEVRQAVFLNKPAGIQAYGTDTDTVTDSQGIDHQIGYSRPALVTVYVVLAAEVDPDEFPSDGVVQIQDAIAAYGQTVKAGKNVVASRLEAVALGISGVLDATAYIGTAPAPGTTTTISVSRRQLADYDTSRITVNITEGEP